jgi:hypothetical protein
VSAVLSVAYYGNVRSHEEVELALIHFQQGLTATEVARLTGIPRSTVRDWGYGRGIRQPRSRECPGHATDRVDGAAYAYLLGMYLGDGCISAHPRGVWRLRITLDAAYAGIISECAAAVEAVAAGRRTAVHKRPGSRCVDVSNYWKHWPCFFPQHGPGPKHARPIELVEWQQRIVSVHPRPFVRGLIHSDGTRIIATERKGSYVRRAPRYVFSNRSEDILGLFRAACDALEVHCTRSSQKQISIYSKAAVARLDEFVGPKR